MDIEQMALMIPILGIVLGVGIAVVAIVTSHWQKQKRMELRHRERLAAIEKGIELPPDPDPEAEPKKGGYLRSGLVSLFLGVVLYFALAEVAGDDVALFGLIPAAIGVGNLISYFVEGRKKESAG
jgi:hypothetical protein